MAAAAADSMGEAATAEDPPRHGSRLGLRRRYFLTLPVFS